MIRISVSLSEKWREKCLFLTTVLRGLFKHHTEDPDDEKGRDLKQVVGKVAAGG